MSLDNERNGGLYGGSGETRTRLPEGEGGGQDVYGGGRRSGRSSSRSLVTVVGVVVLLIAAIAFANRGGDSSGEGDDAGKKPGANPTAASGTKPVDGKTSGIPSGYAKTAQGAQSAAANYAVALGSADMFDKTKRDGVLQTVMAPSSVNSFKAELDRAYGPGFYKNVGLNEDGSTPKGYKFVSRTSPIGTTVTAFSGQKATVEVWCSGLLGLAGERSTKPVTSSWFTMTMKLVWVGGDWKAATHSQKDGPAPVPGDDRASGSDDIAKAVEGYGGFTYAR
ncbi:hypothetical protein [Streptomyces sp. SYP-A7185]|uniref:hypothetical protein n=1 Tax=Streptomyces sp. SYP-A7185 TaxID=3040076 RepID=UPI0038F7E82F